MFSSALLLLDLGRKFQEQFTVRGLVQCLAFVSGGKGFSFDTLSLRKRHVCGGIECMLFPCSITNYTLITHYLDTT